MMLSYRASLSTRVQGAWRRAASQSAASLRLTPQQHVAYLETNANQQITRSTLTHTCPFHTHAVIQHSSPSSPSPAPAAGSAPATDAAASSTADNAEAAENNDGGAQRKKKSFKIYSSVSERRKAIQAQFRAREESDATAESDHDLAEGAEFEAREEGETNAADESSAEAASGNSGYSESQVKGILAKRFALQQIHPLRMLLTSPRQGLDKVRIFPFHLQSKIDEILRESNYIAGQNEVMRHRQYGLWHVANRTAMEFTVLARVFDEIIKRLPSLKATSILDYGSATHMTLLSFLDSQSKYANRDPSSTEILSPVKTYRSVESNQQLVEYGHRLSKDTLEFQGIEIKHRANMPLVLPSAPNVDEKSNIVVAPFSIGLLEYKDKRQRTLDTLWASVEQDGVLVLVEPGTIDGFQTIRESREYLLDKFGMRSLAQRVQKDGKSNAAYVVAPCGSNGVCPLGDPKLKRSCWHRAEMLTSSLPLRTPGKHMRSKDGQTVETFSYLVLHKGPVVTQEADAKLALEKWQAREKDLTEVGQQDWMEAARRESFALLAKMEIEEEEKREAEAAKAAGEAPPAKTENAAEPEGVHENRDATTEAENAAPKESVSPPTTKRTDLAPLANLIPSATVSPSVMFDASYSRIMRKPLKRGEHVVLDLCNENSVLERRIVPKSWGVPYTLARSVSEGDLWPVLVKKQRDPALGPTVGERRRAELAERKKKRAEKIANMEPQEAEEYKKALKEEKTARAEQKQQSRRDKVLDKRDEAIKARGGVPPPRKPVEKSNGRNMVDAEHAPDSAIENELIERELEESALDLSDLPSEENFARANQKLQQGEEEQDGASSAEAAAAAAAPAESRAATASKKKKTKAKKTTASSSSETAAESNANPSSEEPSASTEAATAATPATPAAPKAKKPSPAAPKLSKSETGTPSKMPVWMESIMAKTRKAPGGLAFTGKLSKEELAQQALSEEEERQEDRGEYNFPMDPSIKVAAMTRRGVDRESIALSLDEFADKAEKAAERAAIPKTDKARREKSPLNFKRPFENNTTGADVETTAPSAPTAMPKPKATARKPTAPRPEAAPKIDGANANTASMNSAGADNTDSAEASGVRLPRWAKYRAIKNKSTTVATAANTTAWPAGSADAPRNVNIGGGDANTSGVSADQVGYFKRLAHRTKKAYETAAAAPPSAAATPAAASPAPTSSSLPPHLLKLKQSLSSGGQMASIKRRAHEQRGKFEAAAKQRSDRSHRSNASKGGKRPPKKFD